MAITRWDPFREIVNLRDEMDRLWGETMIGPSRLFWPTSADGFLLIDMYQTNDDVVIKVSLPGVKPEEVDVSISGKTVTIKAEHREDEEIKDEDYLYRERRHGTFNRVIQMPVEVQGGKAEATYENGVLTLKVPKADEVKPKQIKIKPAKMIEGKKK